MTRETAERIQAVRNRLDQLLATNDSKSPYTYDLDNELHEGQLVGLTLRYRDGTEHTFKKEARGWTRED